MGRETAPVCRYPHQGEVWALGVLWEGPRDGQVWRPQSLLVVTAQVSNALAWSLERWRQGT